MGRESVQNVVDTLSERIFPGLLQNTKTQSSTLQQCGFVYDVKSSLVLQMALHLNLTFYPVWVTVIIGTFMSRFHCFNWFSYAMLGLGVLAVAILEGTRIYLGIVGNMREQIGELSTFWFTTLLVQLPVGGVMLFVALSLGQVLLAVTLCVAATLAAVELGVAFVTLRNVSHSRRLWKS